MRRVGFRTVRRLLCAVLVLAAFPAATQPRAIELAIQGGRLPAEQRVVRVQQGEEVVLRWTTDAPVSLHLHGYDIERKVAPGAPATMNSRARATGRFPITVHGAGKGAEETTLGYLEVHPK